MRLASAVAVVALLAGPGAFPGRAAEASIAVSRCEVRLDPPREADAAGGVTGSVRFRVEVGPGPDLGGFDPDAAGVAASLGPSPLLELGPGEATDARQSRTGTWTLRAQAPEGARARVVLDPSRRRVEVSVSGVDLADLRAAGPSDLALRLRLGEVELGAVVDFREASSRRWVLLPPEDGPPPGSAVAFEEIDSGPRSSIAEFRTAVVVDRGSWEALWKEHAPGTEAPAVDFASESVLGVFLGVRATSGYAVRVVSVTAVEGEPLAVAWEEAAPGPRCIVLQVLTTPFVLVRVPVPGATAAFRGSRIEVDCPER